jgi:Tfp pilus assembly PilM family ATPase
LETACYKLITDVTETLRYYAVRGESEIVKKIFLCGGFALVEGFVDLLNSRLPAAATVLWNPFDEISYDASEPYADILRKKGPALAVAAGLAMRAI